MSRVKLPPEVQEHERKACLKYRRAYVTWEKQQPAFMDAIDEFEKALGKARAQELYKVLDRL